MRPDMTGHLARAPARRIPMRQSDLERLPRGNTLMGVVKAWVRVIGNGLQNLFMVGRSPDQNKHITMGHLNIGARAGLTQGILSAAA